jgi:hypothetical protein
MVLTNFLIVFEYDIYFKFDDSSGLPSIKYLTEDYSKLLRRFNAEIKKFVDRPSNPPALRVLLIATATILDTRTPNYHNPQLGQSLQACYSFLSRMSKEPTLPPHTWLIIATCLYISLIAGALERTRDFLNLAKQWNDKAYPPWFQILYENIYKAVENVKNPGLQTIVRMSQPSFIIDNPPQPGCNYNGFQYPQSMYPGHEKVPIDPSADMFWPGRNEEVMDRYPEMHPYDTSVMKQYHQSNGYIGEHLSYGNLPEYVNYSPPVNHPFLFQRYSEDHISQSMSRHPPYPDFMKYPQH